MIRVLQEDVRALQRVALRAASPLMEQRCVTHRRSLSLSVLSAPPPFEKCQMLSDVETAPNTTTNS